MNEKLVYVGKIVSLEPITGADLIVSATVICGAGGKWRGIVRKADFAVDDLCLVYLPDALIQPSPSMLFMEATNWRVKMRKFKGAPSEVVIVRYQGPNELGYDMTGCTATTKYHKPIPESLAGVMKDGFPSFIPKTDEPNYQSCPELVQSLIGRPYYITEKADGSSTTAYKWKGNFGVCSRNIELVETEHNGLWKLANKYNLREKLPEGIALQWETCGPKIQKNLMGFTEISALAFSAYDIANQCYYDFYEFTHLCMELRFPTVLIDATGHTFENQDLTKLAQGVYPTGKPREGVVIRSVYLVDGKMISFKSINLEYET